MVENDAFTYRMEHLPREQENTAVHCLISKERTQKLDLLIHLLSNLTQALVVCGPEGIGKTKLLTVLQERKTESWRYCLIQGNTDLSFEAIQSHLGKFFQLLSTAYEDQHKQVILIVDDAGELVPGLIATIIQYAEANPALRVIFALTHDELQMKRGSDRVIDNCHIIEIPPLSEKQCGDFLQHLSTKSSVNLSLKEISENMIAHIYRETHGIPGRIIAELSGLAGAKQGRQLKWILVMAVIAACAIAFGVQWLTSPNNNTNKKAITGALEQKADNIEIALPPPEPRVIPSLPPVQPVIPQSEQALQVNTQNTLEPSVEANVRKDNHQPIATPVKPEGLNTVAIKPFAIEALPSAAHPMPLEIPQEKPEQPPITKAVKPVEPSTPNNQKVTPKPQRSADVAEVLEEQAAEMTGGKQRTPTAAALPAQSAKNFTLQLMVLSKQSSVNTLLKKYPALKSNFKSIRMVADGQEKFVIVYGSYPYLASANKAKRTLPAEFNKALAIKINKFGNTH